MISDKPLLVRLDRPPRVPQHSYYRWADHAELLCLVNRDREISRADLLDRVRERVEDLGEGELDLGGGAPTGRAEADDRWIGLVREWFSHLAYRAAAFGNWYPFVLSDDRDVLRVRDELSDAQKLYVFLLLASSLGNLASGGPALTRDFECLAREALRSLLPTDADVHIFGTAAEEGSPFTGSLADKIRALADHIGESVVGDLSSLSPRNAGDGGLDLVGSALLGDRNSSRVILFGQCACTEDWVSKQHSSGPDAWRQWLKLTAYPSNIIFVPFAFRSPDGSWHQAADIKGSILIDRLRILYLLSGRVDAFSARPSSAIVEEVLSQSEKPV